MEKTGSLNWKRSVCEFFSMHVQRQTLLGPWFRRKIWCYQGDHELSAGQILDVNEAIRRLAHNWMWTQPANRQFPAEYIGQLETEIATRTTEAHELRLQKCALYEENARLNDLARMLLGSPSSPASYTLLSIGICYPNSLPPNSSLVRDPVLSAASPERPWPWNPLDPATESITSGDSDRSVTLPSPWLANGWMEACRGLMSITGMLSMTSYSTVEARICHIRPLRV